MAIDFPNSPTLNQTYAYEGRTWKWNGTGWQISTTSPSPEVGVQTAAVTVSANPYATVTSNVTLNPMVMITKVTSSVSAWTRMYHSAAAATADASRTVTTDPLSSAGVVFEVLTSTANESVTLNPIPSAINQESPRTSVFPLRVTNNDASATSVALTFEYVFLEI